MKIDLTISNLKASYIDRTLSPRTLIEQLLQRINEAQNPAIWIHRLSQEDLDPYLKRLENIEPESLPLYGIPFAIKDNIDLVGVPTTAACKQYAYTPDKSASVVENLIQAGAIPLGKTNLDQFATGLVGTRTPYGTPRNPIAPGRVPGGSSCGSAVALAEGLASFSLGTDTAGSGRIPAMFNRLWGIKPSRGRLSTSGVVPACRSLDCVSIFSLNGEDGLSVLKVAEGYDAKDAYSQRTYDLSLPKSRKLGIPKSEQLLFFGDAGYQSAWLESLEALKAQGWECVEIDFEPFLNAARLLYEGPWVAERYTVLEGFLKTNEADVYPVTQQIISGGAKHSARDAFAASYKLADLKRLSEQVWDTVTAIVTPTAGGFPTLAEVEADPLGPNSQLGYYTNFMNLLDLCAVAAPSIETESGLPFGLTWIAPRDTDKALITYAMNRTEQPEVEDSLSILLFGAHMEGLALNPQVRGLGAKLIGKVSTAKAYKMVYLPEPAPHRPGIVRVPQNGVSISAEEWHFPKAKLGAFLATIAQPLGLGEIETSDGRKVHGFLCESAAADQAKDISTYGSWRSFLESL